MVDKLCLGYDVRGGAVAMMREGGSGYDARGGQWL